MNAKETLLSRFEHEVAAKRLADIKFFVKRGRVSVDTLANEINLFEDKVAAGDAKPVGSIDRDFTKTRFDAVYE